MITKEAIDSALTAHSLWKKRLQEAIEKGKSEFKVEEVKKDNACQFGKWLYSLPDADKKSREYEKIKSLHAEFHKTAASILKLGLSSRKEEALKRLEHGGDYGRITGKLVLALNDWKNKL
ncbi:MAG: CZB domain-containing protein [Ignavibacteriaceae bacterium]